MTFYVFHRHRVCLVDLPGVEVVQVLGSQGFSQHQVLRGVGV